ncbi:HlyD family efflux transporter periplasmic adaptor subunit [Puteibacter caeruleilacunae]|nr:HlyD family efflux transporter periplasmic adaptor subunit [Puteibacter caeruleilacunae]
MKQTNDLFLFIFIPLWLMVLASCDRNTAKDVFTQIAERKEFNECMHKTGELEPLQTTNINCPNIWGDGTIAYLIPNGSMVKPGDTLCVMQCSEIENRYKMAEQNLEIAKAALEKTIANQKMQLKLLLAQKETIEASSAIKKLDTIQQQFVTPNQKKLIDLELEKSKLELIQVNNKIKSRKKIDASELSQKQLKIKQAEMQLMSSKRMLDQLIIKAPINGIAMRARRYGRGPRLVEGDNVWRGVPIAVITNTAEFQVKFLMSEGEYKLIEKDQTYTANISSIPNSYIKGKIKYKAPVGKPLNRESHVKFYDVTATIDSINVEAKPGFTADCEITIKTVPDAIALPLISVNQDDTCSVVYRKNGSRYEPTAVEVSFRSATSAVITSGINEGDEIALMKPEVHLIRTPEKKPEQEEKL